MKETRTINLNGQIFHIDNDAYMTLSTYLQDIELRLPADDKKEVMPDLEGRIAELLQSALFAKHQQVVDAAMVANVQSRIGAPSEFGENKRPKVRATADNQGCGRALGIALKILLIICALPVLFVLFIVVGSLILAFFGASVGVASALPMVGVDLFGSTWLTTLCIICLLLAIGLPIAMIITAIVSYMRTRRGPKAYFWWITIILWLLSIVGLGSLATKAMENMGGFASMIETVTMMEEQDLDWDEAMLSSETRTVAPFHAIEVTGGVHVNLMPGTEQQVVVRSNTLANVTTEVRDGVLYISLTTPRYNRAIVDLVAPTITAIHAGGASQVDCQVPLTGDSLTLSAWGASEVDIHANVRILKVTGTGASELDLAGSAEQCELTLQGASKADAEDLIAQDMKVNCSGASEAEVHVLRNFSAQATGASSISYKGNPTVHQRLEVGASSIRQDRD